METKQSIGYKDDELFLLSAGEYEPFKANIPEYKCWWWLRSPGFNQHRAAFVFYVGSVSCRGYYVLSDLGCVRPAMIHKEKYEYAIGARIVKYDFPWICIGHLDDGYNLFIAEVPIATRRFDGESNDYETSEIRKFLKDWANEMVGNK